jgi:3-methyladenine DNA glycosylase AlkD
VRFLDLEIQIKNCVESAIDYGIQAHEVVINSKKTNKLYDKQYKNFISLKKHPKGIEALFKLIEHPNMYVRYTSAIHLLSVNEKKAKEIIQSVASLSKSLKFDTHYLLEEWDNGNLKEYYR